MNFIAIKRADIKMSVSLDKELRIFNHLNNCPEIISCFGEQLTDASGVALDIWSLTLGCTVVQMCTGNLPWKKGLEYNNFKDLVSLLAFTVKIPEIPEYISKDGKDFLRKYFIRDPKKKVVCSNVIGSSVH